MYISLGNMLTVCDVLDVATGALSGEYHDDEGLTSLVQNSLERFDKVL